MAQSVWDRLRKRFFDEKNSIPEVPEPKIPPSTSLIAWTTGEPVEDVESLMVRGDYYLYENRRGGEQATHRLRQWHAQVLQVEQISKDWPEGILRDKTDAWLQRQWAQPEWPKD